jgi:type IV pilus assembly protein PilA
MFSKFRERTQSEAGFTLIELLVVMLIIGLLAAIAIPAFFNQKNKATDTQAKVYARTAETAMETYATGNNGSYASASVAGLVKIEPTLVGAPTALQLTAANGGPGTGSGMTVSSTADTYTITVTSAATDPASGANGTFSVARANNGTTTLQCTVAGVNGCPTGGSWG